QDTASKHEKPCLQHMPSAVPALPDGSSSGPSRVSPFASSKVTEKKTVIPSLEQIISVHRKWREHHEKKGGGKKGAIMVLRCPHLQRRRTRETDSWNPQGDLRELELTPRTRAFGPVN